MPLAALTGDAMRDIESKLWALPITSFPARTAGTTGAYPHWVVNGSSGIAVGMATNIPPQPRQAD